MILRTPNALPKLAPKARPRIPKRGTALSAAAGTGAFPGARKDSKPCPPKIDQEPWAQISIRVRSAWWKLPVILQCRICGKSITMFSHLVPDHIKPGKMGGCKDNSEANLQPAHWWCNLKKGSKRI